MCAISCLVSGIVEKLSIVICKLGGVWRKQYVWIRSCKDDLHISVLCQIADVLSEAGTPCGINSVCLYGGTSKGPQIAALKSGVVR